ncbi:MULTISPECIES: hypothetical protein [Nocardioides]|uniref:hypothetical protein n=1 Tax=Nocardioides TaxID=1839 RepID=UPI000CE55267|nr:MULTISPECIES: hypothetical protein [Nocardioides]
MSTQPAVVPFAQTHRILASALISAPVLIAVVLAFIGSADTETDESWTTASPDVVWVGLLLVVGAALLALVPTVGYRMDPLGKGMEAEANAVARGRYQSATFVRFAMAEVPVLLGIVLAFMDGSYLLYLLGAAIGLGLMGLHVWPSRRVVEKSSEVLEADGVQSGLRADFGYASH